MGAIVRSVMEAIGVVLRAQRGQLLCWVPVCLALGIGCYFQLKIEPNALHYGFLVICVLALIVLWQALPESTSPFPMGLALCVVGFMLAGVRAHSVAEPVLGWRYYGAVEGRIVAMDRSQSDALRLTLDNVYLERVPPHRTPNRVRIRLNVLALRPVR
jgi:competence protein ComEC